ncbi:unnamed protein product [Cyprideis torosa]|uniref:Transcription initiation factor TFIID subunit 9 n=1 Tax=Cyprideis torosa TaxID=163714 RepID=A0A7R8WKY4_9CRUS|nr:unnamed protein product [Cyprideis torosa]CAG0901899.1 unnamed protein product [Cyprideis torosa]
MTSARESKTIPKDGQVIISILKDAGIQEWEPRVINQLLEWNYKYVTSVLEDARLFSQHAKKKSIDTEDVRLAIEMQLDRGFTSPPPRDVLMEMARTRNAEPLPQVKPHAGPRLPPERFCLLAPTFKAKSTKQTVANRLGGPGSYSQIAPSIKKVLPRATLPGSAPTTSAATPTFSIVATPKATKTTSSSVASPAPLFRIAAAPTVTLGSPSPSSETTTTSVPTSTTSTTVDPGRSATPVTSANDAAAQFSVLIGEKRKRESEELEEPVSMMDTCSS